MNQNLSAPVGYENTPKLPNSIWHVHDANRPQPRIVSPESINTQNEQTQPPSDAVILFNGTDLSAWIGQKAGEPEWKIENGFLEVTPGTGNIQTREHFGDCQLHLEFASPSKVEGHSQGRGNSGVFLIGEYEIQVLDGYDNRTYADGITAAIYAQYPPLVNACRKPGEWQTYEIFFVAPQFEKDKLITPAYITVVHNGVLVHHHQEALGPTGHKNLASYEKPHGPKGPLMLQDHKNPVRYRNIWIRSIGTYDQT